MVAARCACELPLITVSEGRPGTQRRVSPCSPHTYQTYLCVSLYGSLTLSLTHTTLTTLTTLYTNTNTNYAVLHL